MRVSAIEGHRLWASVYDSGLNPILALERRAMRHLMGPIKPAIMLDVACGTGQWLLYFQRAGSDVFGCDACDEMLTEATKNSSLRGRVSIADAERIPIRASTADLVLCSVSLGYFHNVERVFDEFARVSKPGGLIAVSDLHPEALASGWTRSFRLGEQRYELEHYEHAVYEIEAAALGAGLRRESFQAIHFSDPELPMFRRCGKEKLFNSVAGVPALFVGLWKKPC
jgi:ubiquinone/menaquinone biosynthesis C-methylase UbiE